MNALFVDAQFWIARFHPGDQWHNQAREVEATVEGRPMVTSEAVLVEFLNFFSAFRSAIRREAAHVAAKIHEGSPNSSSKAIAMSEETRRQDDQIGHLRRTIVQAIDPQQIVLFGSHARGEARANSDVDLLVVHDTDQTNREVRRRIEQLFLDRRFGLDLLVRTPEDVRRNVADRNPFYTHDIFEEGRVLYERPQEEASLEAVW